MFLDESSGEDIAECDNGKIPLQRHSSGANHLVRRWRYQQRLTTQLWRRWKQEYITTLAPRGKWRKTGQEPRVGNIVLVHEPGTTWSKWLIGRITDIHPSEDGAIRSATMKTKQGTMTWSARSLHPVEPSMYENKGDVTPAASLVFLNGKQWNSDLSCIYHNSGGQLLKKRQSEMWLTARLFRPGKAAQYKRLRKHPGCLIAFRRFRPPDAEGSVRSRCSSTICQTFDRQANESGLYDVDSSWPTECGQSRRRSRKSSRPAAPAGGLLEPPMSGSLTAGELAIYGADLNHRRLPIKLLCFRPLSSRDGHLACSSIWRLLRVLYGPQLAQWHKQPLSGAQRSSEAAAGGLSDPGSGSPSAEITIWPAVRGYCSSSVRDRWAPSARVGSSRRGR
ncbi:hypothetical protein T12_9354 [Trichinella patagoniensis]|uniref:DUF5641 domain-containing protein n=1 Tax=Trichinella patagoniensis TaxID=990121 RepID=A0A0V1AC63_9BILA|nr:hypothetical protein T12_9354 [Trichinella patagoniensis]